MDSGRKRTIQELLQKYKRYSSLCDIYVEGEKDRKLLQLFFDNIGVHPIIYTINTVEIPQSIVNDLGIELRVINNNKNKNIALAKYINSNLTPENTNQIRCIVDRDFDFFLDLHVVFTCPLLLYTDYNCIEMYAFNEKCLRKFLELTLPSFPEPANKVLPKLEQILQNIFLIRLCNETLGIQPSWANFIDHCDCTHHEISFNRDLFLDKFFQLNRLPKEIQQNFHSILQQLEEKRDRDPRHQIYKDDCRRLFIKYLRKCGNISDFNKNSELFPLMGCIELEDLKQEGLFINLTNWIKSM